MKLQMEPLAPGKGLFVCPPPLRTRWGPRGEQRPQSQRMLACPTLCAAGSWHSGKAHTKSEEAYSFESLKWLHSWGAFLLREEERRVVAFEGAGFQVPEPG